MLLAAQAGQGSPITSAQLLQLHIAPNPAGWVSEMVLQGSEEGGMACSAWSFSTSVAAQKEDGLLMDTWVGEFFTQGFRRLLDNPAENEEITDFKIRVLAQKEVTA